MAPDVPSLELKLQLRGPEQDGGFAEECDPFDQLTTTRDAPEVGGFEMVPAGTLALIDEWRERYCRLLEEACHQKYRAELVRGAERERCVDVIGAELDRAADELRRRGKDPGMQLALLMRLRELLPEAIRRPT